MKKLAQLLTEMQRAGVIRNYALFGAVAQMRFGLADAWQRFEGRFLNE